MRCRRWVSLLTLVAFVPFAAGCNTTVVRPLGTDPIDADGPVRIAGYTDQAGVRHVWEGTVQSAGVDSLLFARPDPGPQGHGDRSAGAVAAHRMYRARQEIVSLEVKREDPLASTYSIWIVSVGVMMLFGVVLGASRIGDSG